MTTPPEDHTPQPDERMFLRVDSLATPRLRRIAEIMSHLPDHEREELAALIFDEVDSITAHTLHAYDAAQRSKRREPE